MAPHSSTLSWKDPMDGGAWWAAVHGVVKSWTQLRDFTFTFHFHALEKEMATHSSVLAWRIPGMEEPGGLLSMGSHRVGHDWSDLAAAAPNSMWYLSSPTRDGASVPCIARQILNRWTTRKSLCLSLNQLKIHLFFSWPYLMPNIICEIMILIC